MCAHLDRANMVNSLFPDDRGAECGGGVAACTVRSEFAAMDILFPVTGDTGRRQARIRNISGRVAAVATDLGVGTCQREMGVTAMIEGDLLPADWRVAGPAIAGKATRMGIIGGVTGDASRLCPLVDRRFMTRFASGHGMKSRQWIVGESVVKPDISRPGRSAVAVATILAELAAMNVLRFVAINAGRGEVCLHVSAMAVRTLGLGMGSAQGKFRLLAMVKLCVLPRLLSVTVIAGCAELSRVHVLYGVTIVAAHRQALVDLAHVARDAGLGGMLALQGEFCLAVIEGCDFLAPSGR